MSTPFDDDPMADGTDRSAPTGDIPARRARFRWSQCFLYVAGAATMLFGAGTLLWNHVIAPRSSGITGQIISGLDDADRIEAEPGALNDFNVLIVTFDTTRADHLECYGNRSIRTPVLNRLAQEGYLFENCVTSVPATLPAHACCSSPRGRRCGCCRMSESLAFSSLELLHWLRL